MPISTRQFHEAGASVQKDLRQYLLDNGADPELIRVALHEESFAAPEQKELLATDDPRMLFLKKLSVFLPQAASSSDKLAAMEPDQIRAVLLVEACGCEYFEAAEICGCQVGTIKSRIYRGRKKAGIADRKGGGRKAH